MHVRKLWSVLFVSRAGDHPEPRGTEAGARLYQKTSPRRRSIRSSRSRELLTKRRKRLGRPTKKERRDLENFFTPGYDDDEWDELDDFDSGDPIRMRATATTVRRMSRRCSTAWALGFLPPFHQTVFPSFVLRFLASGFFNPRGFGQKI